MKKRVFIWVLAILIIAGMTMLPGMVQSSIPTVYYTTPQMKTYENSITCTGTVQSANTQEIYLQSTVVPGEVLVSVGDLVRADDLLVEVDTQLTQSLRTQGMDLLNSLSMQGLPDGIPASASLDTPIAGDWLDMASAYGLSAAVSQYSSGLDLGLFQGMLGESQMVSGSFDKPVSQSTAHMVTDTVIQEIRAPIAGVITGLNVKNQAPTSSNVPIITIADVENYNVLAMVGEADVAKVKAGDKARITGTGFAKNSYTGTVTKIYPTARKALVGTAYETVVDVEIALDKADADLKAGFTAKVEILGEQHDGILTLPYEAIRQDENNNEYVYIYSNGRLEKTVVQTGREMLSEIEILSGLSLDSVVVYNPDKSLENSEYIGLRGRANAD